MSKRDVPICQPFEKISDVQGRVNADTWNACVVVDEARVVLGLLRKSAWQEAPSELPVEQLMEAAPSTFRPHVTAEEMASYMDNNEKKTVIVTTPDGKLVGLLRRNDL